MSTLVAITTGQAYSEDEFIVKLLVQEVSTSVCRRVATTTTYGHLCFKGYYGRLYYIF